MGLGILLLLLAITFVIYFRSNTLKVVYVSLGLLACGVVCFIVFVIAIDTMNPAYGSVMRLDVALLGLQASLILIPSGVIMSITAIVFHRTRKKTS
ncbi:hypothetical protein ATL39_0198 [Sinobaca qinghaiensis]|uniref:Uncharacterized protein n=1 Tax=Sinobaca qinghaiensis TaxID=342944 RepID=A0A419V7B2_9BACL|nr:hypothetical protein [Sinobaca qinghaiensis]RKD75986.1 hypothetical protein ATL39_0198 [Sinobaca qinghaiensis]